MLLGGEDTAPDAGIIPQTTDHRASRQDLRPETAPEDPEGLIGTTRID